MTMNCTVKFVKYTFKSAKYVTKGNYKNVKYTAIENSIAFLIFHFLGHAIVVSPGTMSGRDVWQYLEWTPQAHSGSTSQAAQLCWVLQFVLESSPQ